MSQNLVNKNFKGNIPFTKQKSEKASQLHSLYINQQNNEQKDSIWHQILSNLKAPDDNKEASHILALGYPDTGKSSLIRALQSYGSSEQLSETELYLNTDGVSGIDNAYINVRRLDDESDLTSSDIETQMTLWILQSPLYKDYLKKLLRPSYLQRLVVVIFLDLSKPWNIMTQFNKWLEVSDDIIEHLFGSLDLNQQDLLKDGLNYYNSNYRRTILNKSMTSKSNQTSNERGNFHEYESNLHAPAEFRNIGVPVVTVICKSDFHATLSTINSIGMIDIVIAYLRKVCLENGATLIFTSTHNDRSNQTLLLYQYLTHRLYSFPFSFGAVLEPYSSLFLPSGWDTSKELQDFISKTSIQNFDLPFEIVVKKPSQTSLITQIAPKENLQNILNLEEFLTKLSDESSALKKSKNIDLTKDNKLPSSQATTIGKKIDFEINNQLDKTDEVTERPTPNQQLRHTDTHSSKSHKKKDDVSAPSSFFKSLHAKYKESAKVAPEKAKREKPIVPKDSVPDKIDKKEG